MEIIGLTGFKRCGKNTAALTLERAHGFCNHAFGDELRRMALAINPIISIRLIPWALEDRLRPQKEYRYAELIAKLGYEDAKDIPDLRRFLQRLGTEGVRGTFGPNAWVDALARKLLVDKPERVTISDVRFESEAAWVHAQGGQVWRIIRPGFGGDDPHPSEKDIPNLPADIEIVQHSVSELQLKVLNAYDAVKAARKV